MADSVALEGLIQQDGENRPDATSGGRKKTKKSKKSRSESLRLESSKSKKIHVRSVDAAQVHKKFNKVVSESENAGTQLCKLCNRQVFQMEKIKAERSVWHKTCFKCKECGKQLTVDSYNSHEGVLYCKPHFKLLFQPKAVLDDDDPVCNLGHEKPTLIIRENQPMELPLDVYRASDSFNYGLEELSNLDLKSRFSIFEKTNFSEETNDIRERGPNKVQRSESILSRLLKYEREHQSATNKLNEAKIPGEIVDSSSEDEGCNEELLTGTRHPLHDVPITSIVDIKAKWEEDAQGGTLSRKEELAKQRKEELQMLRARQCQGRQLRLKEMYEQAVQGTKEDKECPTPEINVDHDKMKQIKEAFEKVNSEDGSSKKNDISEELKILSRANDARNLFKQMEQTPQQEQQSSERKNFYGLENKEAFKTTSTMLNLFRRMEQGCHDEDGSDQDDDNEDVSGEESEHFTDDEEDNRGSVRSAQEEELIQIAKERALAKNLREKFERWDSIAEEEKLIYSKTFMPSESGENGENENQTSLNTAKNLRAHFEQLQKEGPKLPEKPKIKVNRFV